jgi:hypothetical protein
MILLRMVKISLNGGLIFGSVQEFYKEIYEPLILRDPMKVSFSFFVNSSNTITNLDANRLQSALSNLDGYPLELEVFHYPW